MLEFFIRRPIFSMVISLVITFAGLVCVGILPIAYFPDVIPPTIMVSTNFPGADATTVSTVVTRPMEQEINGVKGMIYMSSSSTNNGDCSFVVRPGMSVARSDRTFSLHLASQLRLFVSAIAPNRTAIATNPGSLQLVLEEAQTGEQFATAATFAAAIQQRSS